MRIPCRADRIGALLAAACMLAAGAAVSDGAPAKGVSTRSVGAVVVAARVIDITASQWTLSGGRPTAKTRDGQFGIEAEKVVVYLNRQANTKQPGAASDYVSRILATGGVKVNAVASDGSPMSVTCDTADYQSGEGVVLFTGNVVARLSSPDLAEPSTIQADRVTYWMKAGQDDTYLRVEGSPAQVRATPKPPEDAKE